MKEIGTTLLTVALIAFAAVCLISFIIGGKEPGTELETNCDHEYVTTSEYVVWLNSYRTFSKCTKCGKEF